MKPKRLLVAALALISTALVLIGATGSASANTGHNSSTHSGATGRCTTGAGGCLFWGSDATGAVWATPSLSVADLAGRYFPNNGTGAGQAVKNNAASAEDISSEYTFYAFYNENFSGNYDYVLPHHCGNLYYTWNDEASVWLQ